MQNARCTHGHSVQKNRGVGEQLGDLFCPGLNIKSVQHTEANVFAPAFAVRSHVEVHKVISQAAVKVVHCGKIKRRLGFIAVAEYHSDLCAGLTAQKIGVKPKAVKGNDIGAFKWELAEGLEFRNVVCPKRIARRL